MKHRDIRQSSFVCFCIKKTNRIYVNRSWYAKHDLGYCDLVYYKWQRHDHSPQNSPQQSAIAEGFAKVNIVFIVTTLAKIMSQCSMRCGQLHALAQAHMQVSLCVQFIACAKS